MTYSGLWRTWAVKAREADSEEAAAAWLGDPSQAVQHMTDWGDLSDVHPLGASSYDISIGAASGDPRSGSGLRQSIASAHQEANTAAGRQLLQAGHAWADPPPPTLSDHAADAPGFWSGGGGPVGQEDYGQDINQHNTEWGDLGDRHSGGWGDTHSLSDSFQGSDDVNYPATVHQVDRGEIASKQRRQITRMQATDEKDITEAYEFAPGSSGGSQAQVELFRVGSAGVSGTEGQAIGGRHEPGPEYRRAAGPAVGWVNAHGGPDANPAVSTRNRRWVMRRIPGRHFWRHDMRPLFWHTAKTATVTDPGMTHQTSPFPAGPSLSRTTVMYQPIQRRVPPAWDEAATVDGTDQYTPGQADGMWSNFGGL